MAQKLRRDEILKYLEQNGFSTISELVDFFHYSSATIYRDLNELEKMNLVKRSYGGVEAASRGTYMSLAQRYNYMKPEKRRLMRVAAELIEDGDTVFLEGGSTVECIAPYLEGKKNIHVITHNMRLVEMLSEMGIDTVCLGGKVWERPGVLLGDETVENALKYHPDKCVVSPTAFSGDGQVGVTRPYYLLIHVMIQNSQKVYLAIDHSKLDADYDVRLCDFSDIDCVISDIEFSKETRARYPKTEFIYTKESKK